MISPGKHKSGKKDNKISPKPKGGKRKKAKTQREPSKGIQKKHNNNGEIEVEFEDGELEIEIEIPAKNIFPKTFVDVKALFFKDSPGGRNSKPYLTIQKTIPIGH